MYVSVYTVAGGSSRNEIPFPCQIKASAPISVAAELGGCSQNATACQKGDEAWGKTDGELDMQEGKARTLTSIQGFTARLRGND